MSEPTDTRHDDTLLRKIITLEEEIVKLTDEINRLNLVIGVMTNKMLELNWRI